MRPQGVSTGGSSSFINFRNYEQRQTLEDLIDEKETLVFKKNQLETQMAEYKISGSNISVIDYRETLQCLRERISNCNKALSIINPKIKDEREKLHKLKIRKRVSFTDPAILDLVDHVKELKALFKDFMHDFGAYLDTVENEEK